MSARVACQSRFKTFMIPVFYDPGVEPLEVPGQATHPGIGSTPGSGGLPDVESARLGPTPLPPRATPAIRPRSGPIRATAICHRTRRRLRWCRSSVSQWHHASRQVRWRVRLAPVDLPGMHVPLQLVAAVCALGRAGYQYRPRGAVPNSARSDDHGCYVRKPMWCY